MLNSKQNWPAVFDRIGYFTPARTQVLERLRQDHQPLNQHTIFEVLSRLKNEHYDKRGWISSNDTFLADEYPEIIDSDIRLLCRSINQLDFVRTINGCSGHAFHDYWTGGEKSGYGLFRKNAPFVFGYSTPYLSLLWNARNPQTLTLSRVIETQSKALSRQKYVLFEHKVSRRNAYMLGDKTEHYINLKCQDLQLEKHDFHIYFYPGELEPQRRLMNKNKFLSFYMDKLQSGELRSFAVQPKTRRLASQFFAVFEHALQTVSAPLIS